MEDPTNQPAADPFDEMDLYDFELPKDLIAQDPPPNRTDARMMIVDRSRGTISHASIRDLPSFLGPADAIVVNDSRVIPARLIGYRQQTRGRWEGLFLREQNGIGELLSKTRGSMQTGELIVIRDQEGRETQKLQVISHTPEGHLLCTPSPKTSWLELLEASGRIPLPPYIRDGQMTDVDRERYQTVYARNPGSVAAPTAGLHLSDELLAALEARGVQRACLTLHVGLGTFRPVESEDLRQLTLHSEWVEVSEELVVAVEACRRRGDRVIAIGTTSVRSLEGVAALHGGRLVPFAGPVNLVIQPGFRFAVVQGLLTNFHLPKSSLLLLVSALIGRRQLLAHYGEAIATGYRFYSYGDAMWIAPEALLPCARPTIEPKVEG